MTISVAHHLNSNLLIIYTTSTCLISVHMLITSTLHGQIILAIAILIIFGLIHLTFNSFFYTILMIATPQHLVIILSLHLPGPSLMHIANLHVIIQASVAESLTTKLCQRTNGQNSQTFSPTISAYTIYHLIAILMKALKPPGIRLNTQ